MSELYIIVEGQTEQTFVRNILAPKLAVRGIYCHAALLGKPGRKGGVVQFARAKADIGNFLKQRPDTYVSTMFDYYGIDPNWPGKASVPPNLSPHEKAAWCEDKTTAALLQELPDGLRVDERFIPFLIMHEFEALLFSAPAIMASKLDVPVERVAAIVAACGEPEAIDDSPDTAPSKRIAQLTNGYFKKTLTGIAIADQIGLEHMRDACPHFASWLMRIEQLT